MDLESLQVIVIKDTYDIYSQSTEVQEILSRAWALKLKGYKNFFEDGVCPNDKLDYFSNHIIVCRKDDPTNVLAAIRNTTYKDCMKYNFEFPAVEHMFGKNIKRENFLHVASIDRWVSEHKDSNIGYSSALAIDSSLPKNLRVFLFDFICYSFHRFYKDENIPSIIHGVNIRSKIDKKFEVIGFKDLSIESLKIKPFIMPLPVNTSIRLMVSSHNAIEFVHSFSNNFFDDFWDNRIDYSLKSVSKIRMVG